MQPSTCLLFPAPHDCSLSWDRIRIPQNPCSMCTLIRRSRLIQTPSAFTDLLCLSCCAGKWSVSHCVLSPPFRFPWLIYWCQRWQFVSGQFAPMEMTPAHILNSSACIIWELSEHHPNTAHLSILSKLMSLSLPAPGILRTLTYSEMMFIKIVKCFEN